MSMLVANCMITNLAAFFYFSSIPLLHTLTWATTSTPSMNLLNACMFLYAIHAGILTLCEYLERKMIHQLKKLMLFINIYFLPRWYKLKLEIVKKLLDSYIFRQIKLMSWGRILSKQGANTAIQCSILKKLDQKITM